MEALCRLVVERYDGSLKAEHGTGRNIAPFVELEWGAEAYALMRALKRMLDPEGLLNPGVVLNDDPEAHLKHLKPLPACDADRRQVHRVRFLRGQVPVARPHAVAAAADRRLARDCAPRARPRGRAAVADAAPPLRLSRDRYLCRVRIVRDGVPGRHRNRHSHQGAARPAGGSSRASRRRCRGRQLRRGDRRRAHGTWRRRRVARAHRHARDEEFTGRPAQAFRRCAPQMVADTGAPRAFQARRAAPRHRPAPNASSIFPVAPRETWVRSAGTTRRHVAETAERLFAKAGFTAVYPENLAELCCGQPFESKGLHETADRKSAELERAARGKRGRQAADRVRHQSVRVPDEALSRRAADDPGQHRIHPRHGPAARHVERKATPVAIHPVCSVRKMGTVDRLAAHRAALQRRSGDGGRSAVLRLRGRQGLQPAGVERACAAAPEAFAAAAVHDRLFDQPHVRDRPLGVRRASPIESIVYLVDACASSRAASGREEMPP